MARKDDILQIVTAMCANPAYFGTDFQDLAAYANTVLESIEALTETISPPPVVEMHVDSLPLCTRTRNALLAEKIETLGDLQRMDDRLLFKIPNLGRKAVAEIRGVLFAYGAV